MLNFIINVIPLLHDLVYYDNDVLFMNTLYMFNAQEFEANMFSEFDSLSESSTENLANSPYSPFPSTYTILAILSGVCLILSVFVYTVHY